jgi:hypothetical protein
MAAPWPRQRFSKIDFDLALLARKTNQAPQQVLAGRMLD